MILMYGGWAASSGFSPHHGIERVPSFALASLSRVPRLAVGLAWIAKLALTISLFTLFRR